MELIKVTEKNGTKLVSARDLYDFLGLSERFSRFMERNIEYGLIEGVDYTPYQMVHPLNNQEITDYALTLDASKQISMIQRSEKGKQARQYFIECEKKLMAPKTPLERHELIFQGYLALMQQVEEQQEEIGRKAEQIKELAPAASYAKEVLQSVNNWTITTIASELGMTAQKLNQKLHELKIQYKDSDGVWVLYANHKDKGYTSSRTSTYHDSSNRPHTSITTTWTEKGRNFIHASFSQNLIKI